MELLPQSLEEMPQIYETDGSSLHEKILYVKYFLQGTGWTWFGAEWDREDGFFGLVVGLEKEWGYFYLDQLKTLRVAPLYLPIERDLYFTPKKANELKKGTDY